MNNWYDFFTNDPNISSITPRGSISLSLLLFRLDSDNKKLDGAMKMVECISESELDGAPMEMNEPRDRINMEVNNEFIIINNEIV